MDWIHVTQDRNT